MTCGHLEISQAGFELDLLNPQTAAFHWSPKNMSAAEQKSCVLIRWTLGTGEAIEIGELFRNPGEENKEGPRLMETLPIT